MPDPQRLSDERVAEIADGIVRARMDGYQWSANFDPEKIALAREVRELRDEVAMIPAREQAAFTLGAGWGVSYPRDATDGWLKEAQRRYPSPPESP